MNLHMLPELLSCWGGQVLLGLWLPAQWYLALLCASPLVCFRPRRRGRVISNPWTKVPMNRKGCGYQCSGAWRVQDSPQLVTNCTLSVIPPQRKAMVSVILAM